MGPDDGCWSSPSQSFRTSVQINGSGNKTAQSSYLNNGGIFKNSKLEKDSSNRPSTNAGIRSNFQAPVGRPGTTENVVSRSTLRQAVMSPYLSGPPVPASNAYTAQRSQLQSRSASRDVALNSNRVITPSSGTRHHNTAPASVDVTNSRLLQAYGVSSSVTSSMNTIFTPVHLNSKPSTPPAAAHAGPLTCAPPQAPGRGPDPSSPSSPANVLAGGKGPGDSFDFGRVRPINTTLGPGFRGPGHSGSHMPGRPQNMAILTINGSEDENDDAQNGDHPEEAGYGMTLGEYMSNMHTTPASGSTMSGLGSSTWHTISPSATDNEEVPEVPLPRETPQMPSVEVLTASPASPARPVMTSRFADQHNAWWANDGRPASGAERDHISPSKPNGRVGKNAASLIASSNSLDLRPGTAAATTRLSSQEDHMGVTASAPTREVDLAGMSAYLFTPLEPSANDHYGNGAGGLKNGMENAQGSARANLGRNSKAQRWGSAPQPSTSPAVSTSTQPASPLVSSNSNGIQADSRESSEDDFPHPPSSPSSGSEASGPASVFSKPGDNVLERRLQEQGATASSGLSLAEMSGEFGPDWSSAIGGRSAVCRQVQSARPVGREVELDPSVWEAQIALQLQRPPSRQKPPPEALHLWSRDDERRGESLGGRGLRPAARPHSALVASSTRFRSGMGWGGAAPRDGQCGGARPPTRQKPPPQSLLLEDRGDGSNAAFRSARLATLIDEGETDFSDSDS